MRHFILLALLLLSGLTAAQAADYSHSITVGKAERQFYVHVPDTVPGKENLPVVIVMHGGGGNADGMRRQTGMDGVADEHGFIAVYPEGYPSPLMAKMRTWNAGLCCGPAVRNKSDDVAFISAMIDFIVKEYKADASRVYATGHSNGSQMSYRLACELSGKIAAIMANSGQRVLDECHPKRAVPVLAIHGTKDPCALYDGGEKCGGCYSQMLGGGLFHLPNDTWPCRPVRDVASEHAKMNGCEDVTDIVMTKGAVTCEKFKCPANAAVELCSIEGAGHMWAGVHDKGPAVCAAEPDKKICTTYREIVGPQNADVDAGELAWDFFRHYSLNGEVK